MTDRTTKLLLGIIAAALCVNMLHGFVAPISPALAMSDDASIGVATGGDGNNDVYFTRGTRFYLYHRVPKVDANHRIRGYDFVYQGSGSASYFQQDLSMDEIRFRRAPAPDPAKPRQ